MKSPFPGMDPYLESHWGDIHTSLMVYLRNQLNEQLPDDLQARVEESASVCVDNGTSRTIYPDVRVLEDQDGGMAEFQSSQAMAVVTIAEPLVVTIEPEPRTERHVEIVDTESGKRVVTAIEVLSPFNKIGLEGPLAYRRKQRQYLDARVNLVEIDLIRQGDIVSAIPYEFLPRDYRHGFLTCIRRANDPTRAELYGMPLRQPLPNIRLPLRPTDKDVVLRLQPLIDQCYHDGRYLRVNYAIEPIPRLSPEDAAWADALLRSAGRR